MLTFDFISSKYIENIERFEFENTPDEMSVESYLKEKALRLHELQTAITRLYFDANQNVVGFFTLHNDVISLHPRQRERLEDVYGWMLPKDGDITSFPAIKLHYLGVDSRYRKMGYGKHMVAEALSIAAEIAEQSGCNFLTVEALGSTVEFYRKRGFKWISQNDEFANMLFKLGELESQIDESLQIDSETLSKMVSKLIAIRESLGWDQSKLANLAGLEESDIEYFEFSSDAPDIETIEIVSTALGVTVASLFK